MFFRSPIFTSALALTGCAGIPPENGVKPEIAPDSPVVEIRTDNSGPAGVDGVESGGRIDLPRKRRYQIPFPNPIVNEQQKLWDCILQVEPDLFMDCIEPIAAAADCYNEGLDKIVDRNKAIPECRKARAARNKNGSEAEINDGLLQESRCISAVLESSPGILSKLDACFNEETACLQGKIAGSSIICSVEEEEAFLKGLHGKTF